MKVTHGLGTGRGAQSGALRLEARRVDVAVANVLVVLQRHRRRGVEGRGGAHTVDNHGIEGVKYVCAELEPAGLGEDLAEGDPSGDGEIDVLVRTVPQIVAARRIPEPGANL